MAGGTSKDAAQDPTSKPTLHIGLQLRFFVGGQVVPIIINDIDAVKEGREPIILHNPQGVNLSLEKLKNFIEIRCKVNFDSLPNQIRNFLDNTSISLNQLYFLNKPDVMEGGVVKKEGWAEFSIALTVSFNSKDSDHGGLLSDLIGVDMSQLIDISSVTIALYKGNIPEEYRGAGFQPPPLLPATKEDKPKSVEPSSEDKS